MDAGDIWSRYVRYIGAGAVATAGILTVVRGLPTMVGAFTAVARGMQGDGSKSSGILDRTDRDLPSLVRARWNCSRRAGGGTRARRLRRRHERRAARGACRGRRVLRRAVRDRGGPYRRHRRRLVAADLRHHARDPAWNGFDLRCGRLGGRRRARRRPDGRHDRRDRRQQGGRHLAGPEDRMAGRGDTGATAARPADRRRLRVLGGRGDRAAAWRRLRVRLAGRSRRRRPR